MMRRTSLSLPALIVAVCCAVVANAQQTTLPAILEQSKANYPLLKAKSMEVQNASQQGKAAAAEYVPRLTVQHQYTYGTDNSISGSFYPNPAVISPSGGVRARNIYTATWGSFTTSLLEWNVFNFGRIAANVSAARAGLTEANAGYENELFQHQVRVTDAYLLALIAQRLMAIQEANLRRADRFRQVVNAGVRAGMRAGVDSSLAHAEYTRAEMQLLETQRTAETQLLQLAELAGSLTQGTRSPDSMRFFSTLPPLPDTSTNSVNPLLTFYSARARSAEQRSIAVRRSFLPAVTLVGAAWARGSGISPADDSFHTTFRQGTEYSVYNYMVGISTRWTITDAISVSHRYRGEHYAYLQARELYNEQHLKVQRQQQESLIQYNLMREQALRAPVQLAAAQRAYRQAFARYSSGLTDLPTLLQSMVTLSRAEADMAVSYSNAWRALLAVAASQGDLNLFLDKIQ